jgi:hypothetical protein
MARDLFLLADDSFAHDSGRLEAMQGQRCPVEPVAPGHVVALIPFGSESNRWAARMW